MISEKLQKAREFEEKYAPFVPEEERADFHVTGAVGWINDPNGFSYYKGEYHLFFQYHPYSVQWGPMHWGHVKTKDFIKWERLPIALAPDAEQDRSGCYSGSAIELPDGRMLILYTGMQQSRDESGQITEIQEQCVAIGDGIDFEKYEGNPVISAKDLPEGGSIHDFRDPKIWRESDGLYYCVIGNRTPDGSGAILMYRSEDAIHWNYVTTLEKCCNEFGKMWECPDFFSLDGKQILMTSPQEMMPMGLEFHAGFGTLCMIGEYDRTSYEFSRENVSTIDYGLDFYAPQTMETPDGRRIMIAWMQNWSTTRSYERGIRIFGEMTVPRELGVKNGRLIQNPVRELENYRGHKVAYKNVLVRQEMSIAGVRGRVLDMTVEVKPVGSTVYRTFKVNVAKDGDFVTSVRYKTVNNTIRIDRSRCGFPHDIVNIREFNVRPQDGYLKLRFILDKHSLELFVNDGEQAASTILYTNPKAESISFEAEGDAMIDVEKYELVIK